MKRETKYPPAFETNDRSILGSGNAKSSLVVGIAAKLAATGFFISMSPIRRSLKIVFHCLFKLFAGEMAPSIIFLFLLQNNNQS